MSFFLRKPENPYQREDKMFFEPCTPEKKCIQSLIEFTQDPGSCSSPIGRQMNELKWIQRTHLFFLVKMVRVGCESVRESMVDS